MFIVCNGKNIFWRTRMIHQEFWFLIACLLASCLKFSCFLLAFWAFKEIKENINLHSFSAAIRYGSFYGIKVWNSLLVNRAVAMMKAVAFYHRGPRSIPNSSPYLWVEFLRFLRDFSVGIPVLTSHWLKSKGFFFIWYDSILLVVSASSLSGLTTLKWSWSLKFGI